MAPWLTSRPSRHNAACPKPLEGLIVQLLAKESIERPASAEDVLAALEAIDVSAPPEPREHEQRTLDSLAGGVFVGRRKELGRLRDAFDEVLSGRGRVVMLVGEPGIGKTRTAEELRTYAGLRGARVLWGRSYEGGGTLAYWPWIQAIRSYVGEYDPKRLRAEMGSGAAVIAEVVSDIKERLPELSPPTRLDDPESVRFRLFDAVSTFLKAASKSQPLVIVLDDLHWADKPSLQLLELVAHDLEGARLLTAGTYRDMELNRRHALQQTLAELSSSGRAPTHPDGLTEREVQVLRLIAEGRTNKEFADRLFISRKTVNTHVRNIFEKTGAVNRAEASAYTVRHGL